ncbi:hypothetical protein [Streptomyces sp. NPDC053069]|uniref:hypothetical protein n=1 Tax=Streptomyces sp. NPDC053069 TaxID=3365695 RepID=UPI0037D31917
MRRIHPVRTVLAVLSAPATLVFPAAVPPASARAVQRHATGDTITLPVPDALAALPVQDENRTGYAKAMGHGGGAQRESRGTRVVSGGRRPRPGGRA